MNRLPIQIGSLAIALLTAGLLVADDKEDDSTHVTANVTLPKELDSFDGRTLELRLYEYDPRLADVSADLVEKVTESDFAHKKGKVTKRKIEIGAKGKTKAHRSYYLTTYVLDDKKRTHIGEKDGKSGLCMVITDGNPRKVNLIVRALR